MGKIRPFSLLPFLCFSSLTSPVLAQWDNYYSFSILFSGNMGGEFNNTRGDGGYCVDASMQPQGDASLNIGINPSWDSNPFFFEIFFSSLDGFNYQITYGVDLVSAVDMCYVPGGTACGDFEFDNSLTFSPTELLNLSRADITQTQVGGELGYTVSGTKESTWTGVNNPLNSLLWFDTPCNDSSRVYFNYSNPLPFAYSIFFSNSSANATLNFDTANATVSLSFNGTRNPNADNNTIDGQPVGALVLNTSNPDLPQFQLTNGSQLVSYKNGTYSYGWEIASPNGKANANGNSVAKIWIPWTNALLVPFVMVSFLSFL